MRNRFQLTSGLASVAIGAALLFTVATASANSATDIRADCSTVSVDLVSFPESPSTITFEGTVNEVAFTRTATLNGSAGTVSTDIGDLTNNPNNQPTKVVVQASWTVAGGDSSDEITFDGVCAEQPTTTTAAPEQPLVEGTQEAAAPVVVLPEAAAQADLPRTGADTSPELIALGFVLVLCGLVLLRAIKLSRA
jgi:LPXTG-motif cell wall-anchored protein